MLWNWNFIGCKNFHKMEKEAQPTVKTKTDFDNIFSIHFPNRAFSLFNSINRNH